jgi:hypothetical protein
MPARTPRYSNPHYLLLSRPEAADLGLRQHNSSADWATELKKCLAQRVMAGPAKGVVARNLSLIVAGSLDIDNWLRMEATSNDAIRINSVNLRQGLSLICLCRNKENAVTEFSISADNNSYLLALAGSKGSIVVQMYDWHMPLFRVSPSSVIDLLFFDLVRHAQLFDDFIKIYSVLPTLCEGHRKHRLDTFIECRFCKSDRHCYC